MDKRVDRAKCGGPSGEHSRATRMGPEVQYLGKISKALQMGKGVKVARLLRIGKPTPAMPERIRTRILAGLTVTHPWMMAVKRRLPAPWDGIVANHVGSVAMLHHGKGAQAMKLAEESSKLCYNFMRDKHEPPNAAVSPNWFLPIVDVVLTQLRLSAYLVDKQEGGLKHERAVYNLVRDFLPVCNKKEKNPPLRSLKMGTLFVVNHLLKICFKINLLRNTANLQSSIDSPGFPPLSAFPRSQTVTYKFYVGRIQMMEEKYEEAEKNLEYAFNHCHKDAKTNKLRILQFLIPVKLLQKKMPKARLLQKYTFPQFHAVIVAMRQGDLQAYNEALMKHEDFFVEKGVFLVMEKLKKYVYRNLIKKIHTHILHDEKQTKKNLIQLSTIRAAMKINGVDVDEKNYDEIECILANLIYEGLIKGYIAHARALVVSKKNAFPK